MKESAINDALLSYVDFFECFKELEDLHGTLRTLVGVDT